MTGASHRLTPAGKLYDELLVVLVQSGDRAALERLAKRWHPRLLRTAYRLLRDKDEARVAAQDAWLSIVRGIGSLRDPARFPAWAFGILQRRCADRIRASVRRRDREGPLDADPPVNNEADLGIDLAEAIASLPAPQKLAAQLFFIEGLTLGEIAEAQGVPVGTAKSRLFHARRRLKAALSGELS